MPGSVRPHPSLQPRPLPVAKLVWKLAGSFSFAWQKLYELGQILRCHRQDEMKNSLIIFLLQYNLQHFSLFDFYSPQGGWGCEGGSWYNRFVTNMHRLTGRRRLCFWFQLIKLRPTHWAICFLWPRCCFSHFLAKTKCDSHYYRVLSSLLSSSSLFLIPFGRRCKNVLAVVVVAARRHYYYCFYRYFLYCLWLLAFIRARKWICFLRLDYYDCVWLQILHSMKCCCFFFCVPFSPP